MAQLCLEMLPSPLRGPSAIFVAITASLPVLSGTFGLFSFLSRWKPHILLSKNPREARCGNDSRESFCRAAQTVSTGTGYRHHASTQTHYTVNGSLKETAEMRADRSRC